MSVHSTIQQDLVTALKAKDEVSVMTLRGLKAALQKTAIDSKGSTDDDQRALTVLKQEIKKRQDAIQAYQGGGRADLAAKEQAELVVLERYQPTQLSADAIRAQLQNLVSASADKNFGLLMKQAMEQFGGAADGKTVSTILKELCQ